MSTPHPACRECHREDRHNLSCSHVRYESRTEVVPEDEVVAEHEPPQPYCPGPEVICHFGISIDNGRNVCLKTGSSCYYNTPEDL